MAQSPYAGTYSANSRQTIVHSPDAVVFINGRKDLLGCSQCKRSVSFNRWITSISVDLTVDNSPGSASISLSIPRHDVDSFYQEGGPIIRPMDEVSIYAKGYFTLEGMPQYYPVFWGLVSDVQDNYSSGTHIVDIGCQDILRWWDISQININPAFGITSSYGANTFGNVFAQTNPFDMIFTLAFQSVGDVLTGTGSFNSMIREAAQPDLFGSALKDTMLYWSKRFSKMRSSLLLYGPQGYAVRGDTIYQRYRNTPDGTLKKGSWVASMVRDANGDSDMSWDPTSENVAVYKRILANAGGVDLVSSEFQTKLEIANAAKESIGYEFYMDTTGDIVFKPPFYNLDVFSNKPVSWIQDIDIISWGFSESEQDVVTHLNLQGSYSPNNDFGLQAEINPTTSVTDYHLLRKYGWRSHDYNAEFLTDPMLMFYHGLDVLDRLNATRYKATVTIPLRPELRLGFPVYIEPKDEIWYCTGISHSIQFGGQATTTLNLTAKRSKFVAPRGIGSISMGGGASIPDPNSIPGEPSDQISPPSRQTAKQLSESNWTLNSGTAEIPAPDSAYGTTTSDPFKPLVLRHPKTGKLLGYPNVVIAYSRPFSKQDIKLQTGQNARPLQAGLGRNVDTLNRDQRDQLIERKPIEIVDSHMSNRYHYGLNSAGVFVYAYNPDKLITEMLVVKKSNLTVTGGTPYEGKDETALIRPVSDERGFEVIGHYQYGRAVGLRDGALLGSGGEIEGSASVGFQLAVSGDLQSSLSAQAIGVTTSSTNPAQTLTSLTVEENQSSATVDRQGTAHYSETADNHVQPQTLNDVQSNSVSPSVEATELSRALTLTELSVRTEQEVPDPNCPCILGRPDLAFMGLSTNTSTVQGNTALLGSDSEDNGLPNANDYWGTAQQDGSFTTFGDPASTDNTAVGSNPIFTAPSATAVGLVERYLADLYSGLDTLNQQLEQTLRTTSGDDTAANLLDTNSQSIGIVDGIPTAEAQYAPPFNAPNRFQLGDLSADLNAVQSNAQNIGKAIDDFSARLRDLF